jgi:hypothetical protein
MLLSGGALRDRALSLTYAEDREITGYMTDKVYHPRGGIDWRRFTLTL